MNKKIIVIAAVAAGDNLMGGTKNDKQIIPWYCSEDFKHFKETTMGSAMIMGRKTLESLPGLLPGRPHIYLSRDTTSRENVYRSASLAEAVGIAEQLSESDTIYIIGGAEIISLALQQDIVDEIILTKIYAVIEEVQYPVYFPLHEEQLKEQWEIIETSDIRPSQKSKPDLLKYEIIKYKKKPQK